MSSPRLQLIYNPRSGFRSGGFLGLNRCLSFHRDDALLKGDCLAFIQDRLRLQGWEVDTVVLAGQVQASECVLGADDRYDLVVVAGGDGTVQSVVRGMMGLSVPLGIIPIGSANVLALSLGIPASLEQACDLLGEGRSVLIDCGEMRGHFFTAMLGVGFDAAVIRDTPPKLKARFGPIAFLKAVLFLFLKGASEAIEFCVDDEVEIHRGFLMLCCNSPYYGGQYQMARDISLSDGVLDVIVLTQSGRWALLRFFLALFKGRLLDLDFVRRFRVSQLRFCSAGHPMHVDAEYIGQSRSDDCLVLRSQVLRVMIK